MGIVFAVLQIVAPVFILAGIGFVWVKLGGEYRVQFVTRLAMTLGVPSLIFVSLMRTKIEPSAMATVLLATCAAYFLVTVMAFAIVKIARLDIRTFLAPIVFGNTGNIGLPLALFAYGDVGLDYAVVIFAVMALYSFTAGVWVISGGGAISKVVKEPMVGATALGALFLYNGWQTPAWATNTLELIGQMAIPLMLITLGVALARLKPTHLSRAVWISLVKVAFCVLAAVIAGTWFDLPPVAFAVLVLQISAPVAVTSYLLAEKYDANADDVAGLVVVSTVISVATIPLTLAFLL